MFQANLLVHFWSECVLTYVHLINRTPSGVLGNKTSYEMIFGHAPDFDAFFNGGLVVCALLTIKNRKGISSLHIVANVVFLLDIS